MAAAAKLKSAKKTKKSHPKFPVAELNAEEIRAIERGDKPQTVVGHLGEMRSRLLRVLILLILATMIPFFTIGDKVLLFLMSPFTEIMHGQTLNVFNLTEGFMLQLKSCFILGLSATLPYILFQVWAYIRPAIDSDKRTFIRTTLFFAILMFYLGAAVTFKFLMPFAVQTLIAFTPAGMNTLISASNFLSFMLWFSIAMGIIFEMPLAIMILTRTGLITPQFLSRNRKYAIILIWVASAIITPTTDIITQAMVALPLMLLYELSLLISRVMIARKNSRPSNS